MTILQQSPLRHPTFRIFYIGCVCTALGYTMQGTLAAWLMATLSTSAIMVALVQTATAGPMVLFGLIAGSLADNMDRRRVILVTQAIMLGAVIVLGVTELTDRLTATLLLVLTFVVGTGFAFYLPAQMAGIQGMVSRDELPAASALNAVAFNAARAVGPAFAGALAAWLSAGSALLASGVFFVVMVVIVHRWKPEPHKLPGPTEGLLSGVRAGLRFARHSTALRAMTVRNLAFSLCASAFWALLPLIAKEQLNIGAGGFGLLFAAFGSGAIVGAWLAPRFIRRASLNATTTWGAVAWSAAVGLIAMTHVAGVVVACAAVAGAAWVTVLSSLSAGTQSTAPAWMRARAVSIYLVGTQAGLAVGSAIWGAVATAAGIQGALLASAGALLVTYAWVHRLPLQLGTEADTTPHPAVGMLAVAVKPDPDDGPVLIQFRYRIESAHQGAFLAAMEAVGPARRRSGASNWGLFRDLSDHECFVERYVIESWADYLRQRERMTQADKTRQEAATQFQKAGVPVELSRLIGVELGANSAVAEVPMQPAPGKPA